RVTPVRRETRTSATETSPPDRLRPAVGVKRGKLYPEQGQVRGRNPVRRGRGALPSPRVGRMNRRATGGQRWMAITASNRGTELGLQAASLARILGPPQSSSGRKMCAARQALQIASA